MRGSKVVWVVCARHVAAVCFARVRGAVRVAGRRAYAVQAAQQCEELANRKSSGRCVSMLRVRVCHGAGRKRSANQGQQRFTAAVGMSAVTRCVPATYNQAQKSRTAIR